MLFVACKQEADKGELLAKVYDEQLHAADVAVILPEKIEGDDSVRFIQTYINQWVKERLLIRQAERNLDLELLDIDNQIQTYRNELVIFNFKEKWIQQNLDTIVSNDELELYYEVNKHQFSLRDHILQLAFLKLSNEDRNIKTVKKLMKSMEDEDKDKLQEIASRSAANYFLEDNIWILFDDFAKSIPVQANNPKDFLVRNPFFEVKDSLFTYIVRINDFRLKGDISPMNFEIDRIKSMIINRRKLDLIKQMEEGLLNQAQEEGKAVIYTSEKSSK